MKGGGVKVVEKIKGDETIKIYNKEDIEDEIINANKEKLLQADNTPLRTTPLQDLLGEQGDYEKWEKILKGEIKLPTENIEEGTRLWFDFMSRGELEDIDLRWTTQEYFKSWKKMPEDKGSAPGWSFAHIKSVCPTSQAA